jgi:hypothetical protein
MMNSLAHLQYRNSGSRCLITKKVLYLVQVLRLYILVVLQYFEPDDIRACARKGTRSREQAHIMDDDITWT